MNGSRSGRQRSQHSHAPCPDPRRGCSRSAIVDCDVLGSRVRLRCPTQLSIWMRSDERRILVGAAPAICQWLAMDFGLHAPFSWIHWQAGAAKALLSASERITCPLCLGAGDTGTGRTKYGGADRSTTRHIAGRRIPARRYLGTLLPQRMQTTAIGFAMLTGRAARPSGASTSAPERCKRNNPLGRLWHGDGERGR